MLDDILKIKKPNKLVQASLLLEDIAEVSGENVEINSQDILNYIKGEFNQYTHDLLNRYGHIAIAYEIDRDITEVKRKFNNDIEGINYK